MLNRHANASTMKPVSRTTSLTANGFCRAVCRLFVIVLAATNILAADSPSSSNVTFSKEIAPLLVTKCMICHNAEKAKGGYCMESFETFMKGGDSKESPIVPGEPSKSKLYQLITATDPDDRMPQKDEPLPAEQTALIEKWIKQGARFDRPNPRELFSAFVRKNDKVNTPSKYPMAAPILALAFDTNGEELVASGYGEVTFWNPTRGTLLRRIGGLPSKIQALACSPDGSALAICGGTPGISGELVLLPLSGTSRPRVLASFSDLVLDATFSPGGSHLAAAGADNSIRVYEVPSGREQLVIQQHADWVNGIAFSHDGRHIASASRDRSARIFDAKTGELETTYTGHDGPVQAVVFSPDDKLVCSAGRDKKLHIWDVKEGKKTNEISGAEGEILKLIAEGEHLFPCGADKLVREYDFAGKQKRTFSGHNDWVYSLAIDSVHHRLASGAFDGEVRLWDLESGDLITAFHAAPGLQAAHAQGSER